jgi:hypothetical protein
MHEKSLTILDFDEAAALARQDPEAYERYRLDAVEALITRASMKNQQHLRRLQWRIDQERKRAPNAAAACVKIYQMMWDTFAGDKGFVDIICNGNYPSRNANDTTPKAKVLSFLDGREQSENSE